MTDLHRAFGAAIRHHRQRSGLSQEDLADVAGIHRTYVSAVELGKVRLGLAAAQRLAAGLGIPLSQMVLEAEERIARDHGVDGASRG